ncbi:MAG TPA: redoxin domain-containing protein [Elainellaceae cyanobacterium]
MTHLAPGDPAPWFTLPSSSNPNYHFDTVGGYYVILFFFGSTQNERVKRVVDEFCDRQEQLMSLNVPFLGVSVDPGDRHLDAQVKIPTYCKFFWDEERRISLQYGVCQPETQHETRYAPTAFVLDPMLRILHIFPLQQPDGFVEQIFDAITPLSTVSPTSIGASQAPVLFIPRVFEPDFCQHLIDLYEADGGRDSGFMRQIDGKTVEILDHSFKQRRDFPIVESKLLDRVNHRILRRVKPEIAKAFQFQITRFERHLVACYEAQHHGFFNRHRDNTTKGTAHRRFAMTLNLNTGDYDGGYLRFPEFGNQLYRPGVGEALIFSCSLLHEATPITKGRRFALLSFFYDDDAARIREQNQKYVALADTSLPAEGDRHQVSANSPVASSGFQPAALAGSRKKRRKKRR